MKVKNTIAAICGIILIACMATGLPVFAAETDDVVYIDIDGDGQISDAEREYAHALKFVQDFNDQYDAVMEDYNALLEAQAAEATLSAIEASNVAEEQTTEAVQTAETTQTTAAAATTAAAPAATTSTKWSGQKLTKNAGTVIGPSGKEVYYNMNMTKVIEAAQSRGISGSFWVREDGVKMLGNYIMTAVSYDVHPYGSTFETSLGTAIAVDTGGFATTNPTMIDIAVRW